MGVVVYDLEIKILRADGLTAKEKTTFGFQAKLDPYVEVRLCPKGDDTPESDKVYVGRTPTSPKTLSPEWEPLPFTAQLPTSQFTEDAMFELTLMNSQDNSILNRDIKDDLVGVVPVHIPVHGLGGTTTRWYGIPASSTPGREATGRVQCILTTKRAIQTRSVGKSQRLSVTHNIEKPKESLEPQMDRFSQLASMRSKSSRAITKSTGPTKVEILEIEITVNKGAGLAAKDHNLIGMATTSDPYVEVRLCPDGPTQSNDTKIYLGKTPAVWRSLEPSWNHTFFTALPKKKLSQFAMFELTIMDWDDGDNDDLMGVVYVHIPIGRSGTTTKWYEVPASSAAGASGKVECTLTTKKVQLLEGPQGSDYKSSTAVARPNYKDFLKTEDEPANSGNGLIRSSSEPGLNDLQKLDRSSMKVTGFRQQMFKMNKQERDYSPVPQKGAEKTADQFEAKYDLVSLFSTTDRAKRILNIGHKEMPLSPQKTKEQQSPTSIDRRTRRSTRDLVSEYTMSPKRRGRSSTLAGIERVRSRSASSLGIQRGATPRRSPGGGSSGRSARRSGSSRRLKVSPMPRVTVKDISQPDLDSDSDPDPDEELPIKPGANTSMRENSSRRDRTSLRNRSTRNNGIENQAGGMKKSSSTGAISSFGHSGNARDREPQRSKRSSSGLLLLGGEKERRRSKGSLSPRRHTARASKKSTPKSPDQRGPRATKSSSPKCIEGDSKHRKSAGDTDQIIKRLSSGRRLASSAATKNVDDMTPQTLKKSSSLGMIDLGNCGQEKRGKSEKRSSTKRLVDVSGRGQERKGRNVKRSPDLENGGKSEKRLPSSRIIGASSLGQFKKERNDEVPPDHDNGDKICENVVVL